MAVYFDDLWRNHPANRTPPEIYPCRNRAGAPAFDNQCVIRLGEALTAAGVSLASYRGAFCWHGHGRRHPLRVEQFKHWLDSDDASFLPYYALKYRRSSSGVQKTYHHFAGRTGVVAFINFWGTGNNGDHIDLWNGSRIARGDRDYFERSQEIWFWHLR